MEPIKIVRQLKQTNLKQLKIIDFRTENVVEIMKNTLRKLVIKHPKVKKLHNSLAGNKIKASKDNTIDVDQALFRKNHIEIKGEKNHLKAGENTKVYGCTIDMNGHNNRIDIAENVTIVNADIKLWGDNNVFEIGEFTTFNTNCQIKVFEGTKIIIGRDCMLSYDVDIRSSDGHPIFDEDGNRINQARDIFIDDHVWVGSYVNILKGVSILNGSVVGSGSLVTDSSTPANVVIAGRPAVILKSNIYWQRKF